MSKKGKKNITFKQIAAWVTIILLIILYLTALILSLFAKKIPENMWFMVISATVFVPIIMWVFVWLFGKLTGSQTFLDSKTDEDEKPWDSQDVE